MTVFLILLFVKATALSSISGPALVTSIMGESVQISCLYHPFYSDKVKFWCRGSYWYFCRVVVRSDQPQNMNNNVKIIDNKNLGIFTVTMKAVRLEDSDSYWCAIETAGQGVSFAVSVRVSERHKSQITSLTTTTTIGTTTTTTTIPTSTSPATSTHSEATTCLTPLLNATGPLYNSTIHVTSSVTSEDDPVWRVWRLVRWILFVVLFLFQILFNTVAYIFVET
ncbi:CMRF35-like molecule 3 [Osmerus eperlanus]|uniref:CMRF35-like molecule 3 n=1 Tax=Osmerus eperlanus TaxID=29151 RepID=UPI002E15C0EB